MCFSIMFVLFNFFWCKREKRKYFNDSIVFIKIQGTFIKPYYRDLYRYHTQPSLDYIFYITTTLVENLHMNVCIIYLQVH